LQYQSGIIIFMAMTLRLSPELDKKLDASSTLLGISKQQAVAQAVKMFVDSVDERIQVAEAMDAMMIQDKKLLERLADA